jgi:hypothetical protein
MRIGSERSHLKDCSRMSIRQFRVESEGGRHDVERLGSTGMTGV